MDTIETTTDQDIRYDGGRHTIRVGVTYDDPDTPEYRHSVSWGFQPTFATDAQTPFLALETILHKKYYREIDVEPETFTTDDGSNIVQSHGWGGGPYTTDKIPESVYIKMKELFGEELAKNTIKTPENYIDPLEERELPEIPEDHTVEVFDIELRVDASYTEEIDKDDPRVTPEAFTSHMKDSDGEILDTFHEVNHSLSWWIEPDPTTDDPALRINKCIHKTWDDQMVLSFEEEYPRENIVESYTEPEETPTFDSIPKSPLSEIAGWFGVPLVRQTLESLNSEVPTRFYSCMSCDSVFESTPRDDCPQCGDDSLIRYESREQYLDIKENETENERKLKEYLAGAEVTVSEPKEL